MCLLLLRRISWSVPHITIKWQRSITRCDKQFSLVVRKPLLDSARAAIFFWNFFVEHLKHSLEKSRLSRKTIILFLPISNCICKYGASFKWARGNAIITGGFLPKKSKPHRLYNSLLTFAKPAERKIKHGAADVCFYYKAIGTLLRHWKKEKGKHCHVWKIITSILHYMGKKIGSGTCWMHNISEVDDETFLQKGSKSSIESMPRYAMHGDGEMKHGHGN